MQAVKELNKQKTKINMVSGTLWNKILIFALPIALQGVLQQIFNSADIAVVGRFTEDSVNSIAAVGANSPIIGLFVNLFLGMALGTNVIVAKSLGEKDFDRVEKPFIRRLYFR